LYKESGEGKEGMKEVLYKRCGPCLSALSQTQDYYLNILTLYYYLWVMVRATHPPTLPNRMSSEAFGSIILGTTPEELTKTHPRLSGGS